MELSGRIRLYCCIAPKKLAQYKLREVCIGRSTTVLSSAITHEFQMIIIRK